MTEKHEIKEQGKTKHETPRIKNHKATINTIGLDLSVSAVEKKMYVVVDTVMDLSLHVNALNIK